VITTTGIKTLFQEMAGIYVFSQEQMLEMQFMQEMQSFEP
jgi:hypothetical protein